MTISDHRDLVAALLGVPASPRRPSSRTAAVRGRCACSWPPAPTRSTWPARSTACCAAGSGSRWTPTGCGCSTGSGPARSDAGTPVERAPAPVREPAAEPPNGPHEEPPPPRRRPGTGRPAPPPPAGPRPRRSRPRAPGGWSSSGSSWSRPGSASRSRSPCASGDRVVVGEAEGAATERRAAPHRGRGDPARGRAVVGQDVRFFVEHVELAATGRRADRSRRPVDAHRPGDPAPVRRLGGARGRPPGGDPGVLAAVNRRVEPMLGEGSG